MIIIMKNRREKTLKRPSVKVARSTVPVSQGTVVSPVHNFLPTAENSRVPANAETNHPLASILGTYEGTFWEEIFDALEQDRRKEDEIEDSVQS
jgi:hypothetical protein